MKKLNIITFFTILTFFLLISTYGIFESGIFRDVIMDISKWEVEINGSIVTNEQKTFSVNDITWNYSDNVAAGKVAPGMDGYFDIIIDPKSTDVSVRFDITYDIDFLNQINPAIIVTKVEEINGNKIILTDKNTYTGVIDIEEINSGKIYTIRTYIKWEDLIENNELDYLMGSTYSEFELPVSINVTQYIGEEIIEYIDSED